jgi:5-methylcytosine-specific restriction endonuclease McrA
MQRDQHGKEGNHGWEIDHINPTANGGSDDLSNLQPLWWKNNRRKSDTYPWSC